MWAEFVLGSLPCSERILSGQSSFPLSYKTNTSKFQFHLECTRNIPACSMGKQIPNCNQQFSSFKKSNGKEGFLCFYNFIAFYDFKKILKDKIKLPLFSQSFSSDRIFVSSAVGSPRDWTSCCISIKQQ